MINGISYHYIIPNEWATQAIGLIWRLLLSTLREIVVSGQQLNGATIVVVGVSTTLRLWNARLCWWFSKPGDLIALLHYYTFSPNLLVEQFPEFERIYEIQLPSLSLTDALNDIVLLNLTYSVLMPQIWVDQGLTDEILDALYAEIQRDLEDPDSVIFTLGGVTVQLNICQEAMCWWFRDVDDPDRVYFESPNLQTQGPVASNGPLRIYWPDDDDDDDDGNDGDDDDDDDDYEESIDDGIGDPSDIDG
ncbi:uncharacterized protein LOC106694111 [Microplitis demolitor]|uniref:uncharacterized protein LOC106694111 n=1 Tax=Microplitis demolitor TaxID=69319 RepID=UPI0006D4F007|nr:uncharacterized protein LOC106694111 [Microplitis demolitor]XP_053595773.1 uncharacterized protein LOC106694111 [Microplitis demolitor]